MLPSILPAINEAYGIGPMVFAPMMALACCAFFMSYMNQWAIMSESIAGDRTWAGSHRFKYSLIYFAASLIAMLVSVPLFQNWGLIV
jgi:hypothetical protein